MPNYFQNWVEARVSQYKESSCDATNTLKVHIVFLWKRKSYWWCRNDMLLYGIRRYKLSCLKNKKLCLSFCKF